MHSKLNIQGKAVKLIISILLLGIVGGIGYFFLNNQNVQRTDEPSKSKNITSKMPARGPNSGRGNFGGMNSAIPVRIITATKQDFAIYYKALGTVTAQNTVKVKARVSGQLTDILFTEGGLAKAGDVLAQIDDRNYQASLNAAYGVLLQSKAQLRNAELDLRRYKDLVAKDSISQQTLDTQVALVEQYKAQVKVNTAKYDEARLNFDFTKIRAPISGRLGLKQVDVGNLVGSGDANPITVITQTSPITVLFALPEQELSLIIQQYRANIKLPVEVWNRADQILLAEGMLHSLDNQIDIATGTLKLKAQFANEDESLFPNQFVNVKIRANVIKDAILIAADAVQYGSDGAYVYVVDDDNSVHLQNIKTGIANNGQILIKEGLKEGAKVVLEGTDRLRDGSKVEIVSST